MDGVTVLATNVVNNGDDAAGFFAIIAGIIVLGMICLTVAETDSFWFLVFLVPVVIFIWFGITQITDKTTFVQYKVTISDDVSLNEFNTKYDVVSQDGKIYTVVEKNVE